MERDPVSVLFDTGARRLLERAYNSRGEWVGTRVADPPPGTVAHFARLGIDVRGPDNPSSPRAKINAHTRWCRGFLRALYYQHKWYSNLGREGGWRGSKRLRPRTSGALEVEFGRRVPATGVIPAGRAVRVRIRRGGQVAKRAVQRMSDDNRIWTDEGEPGGLMSDPSRRDWLTRVMLHDH